jgi:hypothetical protein
MGKALGLIPSTQNKQNPSKNGKEETTLPGKRISHITYLDLPLAVKLGPRPLKYRLCMVTSLKGILRKGRKTEQLCSEET